MEESERVPAAAFAAALENLDPEALAGFTADVYRAAGSEVTADPPDLTVGAGDDPVRMRAVTGDPVAPPAVDAVVSADPNIDPEWPVVGPADLRQRVLYALDPGTADTVCERHLGQPARSPDYGPDVSDAPAGTTSATGGEPAGQSPSGTAAADGSRPGAAAAGGRRGASDGTPGSGDPLSGTPLAGLSALVGPQAALLGVLVAVVLATSVGAVFVGGFVPADAGDGPQADGGPATPTATADRGPATASPAGMEGRDRGGREAIPNSGVTPTPTPTPAVDESDEGERAMRELGADRYADLAPTCERSFLHVVQLQMNALKYNDNETNDGIRTVRQFASPGNRNAVGSIEAYASLIQREPYAPMLTYDSAEYEPSRSVEGTARVQVTTREDGNVTARYAFRLGKQDEGEYDGCWMTEGVRPLTDAAGSGVE
jgi:hypothetical protein